MTAATVPARPVSLSARMSAELAGRLGPYAQRLDWDAGQLAAYQRDRLRMLLGHAAGHSPFHARRLRGLDPDRFEVGANGVYDGAKSKTVGEKLPNGQSPWALGNLPLAASDTSHREHRAGAHASAGDPWAQQWGSTHSASYGAYYVAQYLPRAEIVLAHGVADLAALVVERERLQAANATAQARALAISAPPTGGSSHPTSLAAITTEPGRRSRPGPIRRSSMPQRYCAMVASSFPAASTMLALRSICSLQRSIIPSPTPGRSFRRHPDGPTSATLPAACSLMPVC